MSKDCRVKTAKNGFINQAREMFPIGPLFVYQE